MRSKITKRWSVNVVSEGQLPLQYHCDGRPLTQAATGTLERVCPVEHLLMAVSSCFALSCRAVLARRRQTRLSFEVVTSGTMAAAAANRLTGVTIVAIFHGGLSESDAAAITQDAKPLCTVANSLLRIPHIVYRSRVLNDTRAAGRSAQAQYAGL